MFSSKIQNYMKYFAFFLVTSRLKILEISFKAPVFFFKWPCQSKNKKIIFLFFYYPKKKIQEPHFPEYKSCFGKIQVAEYAIYSCTTAVHAFVKEIFLIELSTFINFLSI